MKLLKRRRTEEERIRRHKYGDTGVAFSKSKEYYVSGARVSDTVTTFICKENLIYEDMRIRQATKQGWIDCPVGGVFDIGYPKSELRRGRVQGGGKISPTLLSSSCEDITRIDDMKTQTKRPEGKGWVWDKEEKKWFRIRKLIPAECFYLMGVDDENTGKLIHSGISDSQLYKMAGNSIVVDVMYHIFENLFYPKEEMGTLF